MTCTACTLQASYSDRSSCVSCDSTTTLTSGECSCNTAGYVLLEEDITGGKLSAKTCSACPSGKAVITTAGYYAGVYYAADAYTCQSCPDNNMVFSSGACVCNSGYTLVGNGALGEQMCVATAIASAFTAELSSASTVTYYSSDDSVQSITSLTMSHYFVQAAALCKYYGTYVNDMKYCQILANLCALQLFDDSTVACSTFIAIQDLRGTANLQTQNLYVGTQIVTYTIQSWYAGMPWLYFSTGAAAAICQTDSYFTRMSLKKHQLQYVVSTFTLNGTWVGYQKLESLLQYCTVSAPESSTGGGTSSYNFWQYFDYTSDYTYSCQLENLLYKEQHFYELYLYDSSTQYFHPLPVRVTNLRSGTSTPNEQSPAYLCGGDDVLVRRFMLSDIVSGVTSATAGSATTPNVVRYATLIKMETSTKAAAPEYIYPSVLTITYKESVVSKWSSGSKFSTYKVQAYFTSDQTAFKASLLSGFIAAMVFTGLLFLHRYLNYARRNARVAGPALTTDVGVLNMRFLVDVSLLALHSWNMFFFPFMCLLCWYFFVFFKLEDTPSVQLPPMISVYSASSSYYVFVVALHLLGFFQLGWVLNLVYKQCNADICFIDWEPANSKLADGSGARVSVWRTILAANEWAELATERKVDIHFNLFWIAFFLIGLNLQYNATQQPTLSNVDTGKINIVLRFACTTFWWLIISYGQFLWKYLIYDRYISEPKEQKFVDFCTLAKVSVLALDEKFHGYYLHCRSPHQHADSTMVELIEMLHKEEAGLTVDRSLEGAPADVQSFEIFVSGEWRTSFDKMYNVLVQKRSMGEVISHSRGGRSRQRKSLNASEFSSLPPERSLQAWKELAVFLQEFVDNNFGRASLRRVIREPSYIETILGTPPDLSAQEQPSVFMPDRQFTFNRLLFLGIESDLLLLNILSYSLFDLWTDSTSIAILLTYLLNFVLTYTRSNVGTASLSRKTLVDERFLL